MNLFLRLIFTIAVLCCLHGCQKDVIDVGREESIAEVQAWYERQRIPNDDPKAFVNVNTPEWSKTQIVTKGDTTVFITPISAGAFKRELHVTYYDGSYTGLVRQLDKGYPKESEVGSLSINGRPINKGYYDKEGDFIVTIKVTKNNIMLMGTEFPEDI